MLFNTKKYYKIVRSIFIRNDKHVGEVRHSCYIPIYNEFSIIYRINRWVNGVDLFVFECKKEIDFLKELVNQICITQSVVDHQSDGYDDFEYIKCELWECKISDPIPINAGCIRPLHLFLENPECGVDTLQKAKNVNIPADPKQLVTDKVKLTSLVYTYTEDKIIFHEGMKSCT